MSTSVSQRVKRNLTKLSKAVPFSSRPYHSLPDEFPQLLQVIAVSALINLFTLFSMDLSILVGMVSCVCMALFILEYPKKARSYEVALKQSQDKHLRQILRRSGRDEERSEDRREADQKGVDDLSMEGMLLRLRLLGYAMCFVVLLLSYKVAVGDVMKRSAATDRQLGSLSDRVKTNSELSAASSRQINAMRSSLDAIGSQVAGVSGEIAELSKVLRATATERSREKHVSSSGTTKK